MFTTKDLFERRRARSRAKLRVVAKGQPRLTVHRSSKHIYAQVIDDRAGNTLAAASSLDASFKKLSGQRLMPQRLLLLANSLRSGPKPRGSRLWYSIVVDTFFMVA